MKVQVCTTNVPDKFCDELREGGDAAVLVMVDDKFCYLPFDKEHTKPHDLLFVVADKIHDEVTESVNNYIKEFGSVEDSKLVISYIIDCNTIRRGSETLLYRFDDMILPHSHPESYERSGVFSEGTIEEGKEFTLEKNESYIQIL
jgi:hypothetical protein